MARRKLSSTDTATAGALILSVKPTAVGRTNKNLKFVQNYLVRFGYLEPPFRQGVLDRKTAIALRRYQTWYGMQPTGAFTAATRRSMAQPRCGVADILHPRAGTVADSVGSHLDGDPPHCFSVGCAWDHHEITFAFDHGTGDVAGTQEYQAVRSALLTWQAIAPLTFTEVALSKSPDVVIDWRDATDPDSSMVGGGVAHADFPPGCSQVVTSPPLPLHFDDSEHVWTIGAAVGQIDIETTALHELGHIIGLYHSYEGENVMYAYTSENFTKRVPTDCDIDGVIALYPAVEIWRGGWTKNWTHFVPFALNGQPHLLSYKTGTGEVDFDRLTAGGTQTVWETTWTKGWSHFTPFVLNGKPYMLSYKKNTGEVDIDRILPNGTELVWEGTWTKGWSHFVPFVLNGQPHMLSYKVGTGEVDFDRLTASGTQTVWETTWTKGWSHFMPFVLNGKPHMLSYKKNTGEVDIDRIMLNGTQLIWEGTWTKGWSSFVPITQRRGPCFLSYKTATGEVDVDRINVNGQGTKTIAEKTWTKGWTHFVPFQLGGRWHELGYKFGSGIVAIDRFWAE